MLCIDLITEYLECHINDVAEREEAVEQAMLVEEAIDEKSLKKLHHIFGHTSATKLL